MNRTLDEKKQYLRDLAVELNYNSIRVTLNPNKISEEEDVIDDMISLFESLKSI